MQRMKLCLEKGELTVVSTVLEVLILGPQPLEWEQDYVTIIERTEVTLNQQYCFQMRSYLFM